MASITVDDGSYLVQNRADALAALQHLDFKVATPDIAKANAFSCPLGEWPARGWFLMLRKDIDALDKNGDHTITFEDTYYNVNHNLQKLNFVKAHSLFTGRANDPDCLYLTEWADRRWLCCNPHFCVPINKHYNVRAPGHGGEYYEDSRDNGADWTWARMLEDIWDLMLNQLGSWPGMPASGGTPIVPNGKPENWRFVGMSAWRALNKVLTRLGFAVKADLTKTADQYTLVRVGEPDTTHDGLVDNAESANRLLNHWDTLEGDRTKIPYGIRVNFHVIWDNYGADPTTAKNTKQPTTLEHHVDIDGPNSNDGSAEDDVYHPIWDDLPAIFDHATGAITATSQTDCQSRAQERADDFYRMLKDEGGERLYKQFSGIVQFYAGSSIKGLCWRQDSRGAGGLVTEIVRHPFLSLRVGDDGQWQEVADESSTSMQPPDYRPTFPVYPHLVQHLLVGSAAPITDPNGLQRWSAHVVHKNSVANAWMVFEEVWATADNGLGVTALELDRVYPCRMMGYVAARPLYNCFVGGGSGMDIVRAINPVADANGLFDGRVQIPDVATLTFTQGAFIKIWDMNGNVFG